MDGRPGRGAATSWRGWSPRTRHARIPTPRGRGARPRGRRPAPPRLMTLPSPSTGPGVTGARKLTVREDLVEALAEVAQHVIAVDASGSVDRDQGLLGFQGQLDGDEPTSGGQGNFA